MKKISLFIICILFCTGLLSGCAPEGHINILLLTDNINSINPDKSISLSDYVIVDNCYRLPLKSPDGTVLLTAEENEKGEIVKIRLTVSKTDEKGNLIPVSASLYELFTNEASLLLQAFTLTEKSSCEEVIKKILPMKSEDLSKTGELTMEYNEFHLVYYSNKICSQFTVVNTFLEETETTEKPVSKPLYDVTATARAES